MPSSPWAPILALMSPSTCCASPSLPARVTMSLTLSTSASSERKRTTAAGRSSPPARAAKGAKTTRTRPARHFLNMIKSPEGAVRSFFSSRRIKKLPGFPSRVSRDRKIGRQLPCRIAESRLLALILELLVFGFDEFEVLGGPADLAVGAVEAGKRFVRRGMSGIGLQRRLEPAQAFLDGAGAHRNHAQLKVQIRIVGRPRHELSENLLHALAVLLHLAELRFERTSFLSFAGTLQAER